VNAAMGKIHILYCTKCQGMLASMQAFSNLIDELQAEQRRTVAQPQADGSDLQRKTDCPQCHHRMDTHFYAGPGDIVIDSCEGCSLIWLDRGELMHIVHAPDELTESASFDSASN
jgi:Zn-finger nucleic acid-binding protein